ncbi:MAG: DUF3592 domain-containing protein [Usitatibacter sp.]
MSLLMLGLAGYFLWVLSESLESRGWPHVQGSIVKSYSTRTCGTSKTGSWEARIVYRYVVEGKAHQAERLGSTMILCRDNRSDVERWLEAHYPVDKAVEVYYNGANPDAAFLEPGDVGVIDVIMISAALILSALMAFLGWRSLRRR